MKPPSMSTLLVCFSRKHAACTAKLHMAIRKVHHAKYLLMSLHKKDNPTYRKLQHSSVQIEELQIPDHVQ
jgi:hypothetical protein